MQEMMREAKDKAGDGGGSEPQGAVEPTPSEPPRVKSMQEMMREAKEKAAAEAGTGSPPPADPAPAPATP
jgi:hypothetical protein